jgi:hypothetical protein
VSFRDVMQTISPPDKPCSRDSSQSAMSPFQILAARDHPC